MGKQELVMLYENRITIQMPKNICELNGSQSGLWCMMSRRLELLYKCFHTVYKLIDRERVARGA